MESFKLRATETSLDKIESIFLFIKGTSKQVEVWGVFSEVSSLLKYEDEKV
jgi:hypothetical protein